jgi:hypothetical protein
MVSGNKLIPIFGLILIAVGCGNPHIANEGSVRLLEAMTAAQQAQLSQDQSFGLDVKPLFIQAKSESEKNENELVLTAHNTNSANQKLILTNLSQDQLNLEINLEKGEVFSKEFSGKIIKDLPMACENTLAAGKSCLLDVNFAAIKDGHYQDNLIIHFKGTLLKEKNGSKKIRLKADRVSDSNKEVEVLDLSLKAWVQDGLFSRKTYADFGSLKLKEEKSLQLKIKNNGRLAAHLDIEFKDGKNFNFSGGTFPGLKGTCKDILSARRSCMVDLAFSGQEPGLFSDDLIISYEDENNLKKVSLTVNLLGERINQE